MAEAAYSLHFPVVSINSPVLEIATVVDLRRAQKICDLWAKIGNIEAGDSMWSAFRNQNAQLLDALNVGDVAKVAAILAHPIENPQFLGFDELNSVYPPSNRAWFASVAHDALRRLAEVLGVERFWNPEQQGQTSVDVEEILRALDKNLGFRVDFPTVYPGSVGVPTSRGMITARACYAIYQAFLVSQLNARHIVEIGAGLGRTAYYATKMIEGIRYTIVDLPVPQICQIDWAGRVYGNLSEPRFLSPSVFLDQTWESYDLVLNVDSFTEMDSSHAASYAGEISDRARQFLSINHEANHFTVAEIFGRYGMKKVSRIPHAMRRGYVEELWVR